MKKVLGLTVAMALLVPVGLMAAPGGAAATAGTTCKGASGKITLKPGLGKVAAVQTISINLPISGCTGGGVKSGVFKGTLKTTPITAATLATSTTPLKLAATVTWNTKATSTLNATTSTKIAAGKITSTVKGKITKGVFLGKSLLSTQNVTLGASVGGKITSLNIKAVGNLTIK